MQKKEQQYKSKVNLTKTYIGNIGLNVTNIYKINQTNPILGLLL